MSTYKFWKTAEAGPQTILTTIDILGNVLEVKNYGAAHHRREERSYVGKRHDNSDDFFEHSENGSNKEEGTNSKALLQIRVILRNAQVSYEKSIQNFYDESRSDSLRVPSSIGLDASKRWHSRLRRRDEYDPVSSIQFHVDRNFVA